MDLVVLVPLLHRPHRVFPFLESLAAATPPIYRTLFLCTSHDDDVIETVKQTGSDYIICGTRLPGDYARKINRGYKESSEPYLFLGADDLHFHPNWFQNAMKLMTGKIGVVGTNDLGNPRVISGTHSTHSLVSRAYVDQYGTIDQRGRVLHQGYDHTFCDDEFVATARYRGMFAFAADSHVEHLHPNWEKAPWDEVYSMADQSLLPGRRLYRQRRRLWTRPPPPWPQTPRPGHRASHPSAQ